MDRTKDIQMILANQDYKVKLIKDAFGNEEIEEAGPLAANPEAHLEEYLKNIDEPSFGEILRGFNCYVSLPKKKPCVKSAQVDGEEERGEKSIAGSFIDQSKEKGQKTSDTLVASGVKTGVLIPENDLTGDLDLASSEVASTSSKENGLEAQNYDNGVGNDDDGDDNIGGDGNAVQQDSNGIGDDGNAVEQDSNGIGDDGNAVLQDSNGIGDDGNAVEQDSNGIGDDGNAVEQDSDGICDDGNAVEQDSNGIGDDGNVVEQDSDGISDDGNVVEQDSDDIGDDGNVGDDILNVDNQGVVGGERARRTRQRNPRPVPNHSVHVPPGDDAMHPQHVCRHPVCGTCQVPMDRFKLLEMFNLQNITLTREKLTLHQQVLQLNAKIQQQEKDVASFERKLKDTVKLLQSKEHDRNELGKINLYFRKELHERIKKIEDLKKENGVLKDKCKVTNEALQTENFLRENLNDISNNMEQVTEMIGTSQDEIRALRRENKQLKEENNYLFSQLATVTENATREDEEYANQWKEFERRLKIEVKKLKEAYGYLKTYAERYGLRLPLGPSAPMEE